MFKYLILFMLLPVYVWCVDCYSFEGIAAPATRAEFVVPGISGVEAVFRDFHGTCRFDINNIAGTVYNIKLNTQTLDAGLRSRFVKGQAFLAADEYKYLSFKSTHNTVTGKHTMKMHGDLTIKGVSRPIQWDVAIDPSSTPEEARFKATVDIDRRQWGIDSFESIVSNSIKITVHGVMVPKSWPGSQNHQTALRSSSGESMPNAPIKKPCL